MSTYEDMRDTTASDLIKKFGRGSEDVRIAVGVRPSGTIHLGNMSSITLAGILATDIGPHRTEVDLTVCDTDLPDYSDWQLRQEGFVRYFKHLPDPHGCHGNLLHHSTDGIRDLTEGLEKDLGVRFRTKKLSEIQRDERFRSGLKKVLDTPGIMQMILSKVPQGQVLVFPICPQCETSNPYRSDYRDGRLITSCSNPECSVDEYDMRLDDCGRDLAVHFFIDPLRDKTVPPFADIHVFGGDYRYKHGDNKPPLRKVEKIMKVIGLASGGQMPEVLLGPVFYARDGEVMSKSNNNGLLLPVLQRHFGDRYVARVVDLTRHVSTRDIKNVDYSIVDEVLFGEKGTEAGTPHKVD